MAEPLKATFFAWRRRERMVLLPVTLVFLALLAVIIAAFVAVNWGMFSQWGELARAGQQTSDEESVRVMGQVFAFFGSILLFLFPLYILVAAYEAACLRWMIRGEAPGVFGLTLGEDTWRVYGVYWCWFGAQMVISFAMSILMMPLMFMTMGSIMSTPNPDPEMMMRWQLAVQLPMTLAQYLPLIFFGIRFGPAAATSVGVKRFAIFEAWKVTSGRFWSLFGSYALLWSILIVLGIITFSATYGWFVGDALVAMFSNWPNTDEAAVSEAFERVFTPMGMSVIGGAYALNAIFYVAYAVLSYGINARAVLAALEEGKIKPATAAA
jgi:hypothetical protein